MLGFGKELRRAAAESQIIPRLIAERPEEWRIGRLTLVVEPGRAAAQLRYARVAVARAPRDAEGIMTAWRRALASLVARSLSPDEVLPLLETGYGALLARQGAAAGERVALVDLRAEVAKVHRRHTRAQFAWDLARLRQERRLVHGGRRVDLGVATGDAALHPSRVVWIEDDSGAGQFYLHFRMIEEVPR